RRSSPFRQIWRNGKTRGKWPIGPASRRARSPSVRILPDGKKCGKRAPLAQQATQTVIGSTAEDRLGERYGKPSLPQQETDGFQDRPCRVTQCRRPGRVSEPWGHLGPIGFW